MGKTNTKYSMLLAFGFMCSSVTACAEDESPQADPDQAALHIDEQVRQARQQLATRLAIDADEITEETVRVVQWRSGAAGCPDPDMSYTMAIQPGVMILLRAGDELHRYHSGRNGVPFYCPADRAEAPAMGAGEEVM